MSDQPTSARGPAVVPNTAAEPAGPRPGPNWSQRLGSLLLILICLELGLFLLIYPWSDGWSDNYFAWAVRGSIQPAWHAFWTNSFVRGGISGVGAVNIWIAVNEVFRLFARQGSGRS
jgi:hypothetical protein